MSDGLLGIAEKWWTPDPKIVAKLPRGGKEPFINCTICGGRHKQGAIHLDFVGHADLTRAFIEIDPEWQWEPVAFDEEGLPRITQRGGMLVLWARVTLLNKSMLAVGTCEVTKTDADKELVGDMLRNAGMRFGIFGALWSKTDGWQDETSEGTPAASNGDLASTGDRGPVASGGGPVTPATSASAPLPPVAISQPDKPLAAMTMRELLDFATANAITVSGTKADIVRTLEPLVRAASGEPDFMALEPSEDAPAAKEPETIPFSPVIAGAGSVRKGTNSAMGADV